MNFNRVILGGRLTRDTELKYAQNGTAICNISIAVNRKFSGKDGPREEVAFVDCVAFGKVAEMINQHFRKGKPIFVEGRLKFESWEAKEGGKRSRLVVIVEQVQFCDSRGEDGGGQRQEAQSGGYDPRPSGGRETKPSAGDEPQTGTSYEGDLGLSAEDIPF